MKSTRCWYMRIPPSPCLYGLNVGGSAIDGHQSLSAGAGARLARPAAALGMRQRRGWQGQPSPGERPRDLGRHLALIGLADGQQPCLRIRPADELDTVGQAAVTRDGK